MNKAYLHILFLLLYTLSVNSQQTLIPDVKGSIPPYELGSFNAFPPVDGVNLDFYHSPKHPLEINGNNTCVTSPKGGVVYVNLDVDPLKEIVYHSCNLVSINKNDNTSLPGWPITLPVNEFIEWSPSIGDITGDSKENIVFTSYNDTVSKVYAYNINGSLVSGFPITFKEIRFIQSLNDVNGNNINEIVVTENETDSTSKLYVIKGDGSILNGFPYAVNQVVATHAAVGDINNNGNTNIVFATANQLHAIDKLGNQLSGFPYQLSHTNELFSYSSPILVDLDHDFFHEIIIGSHNDDNGFLNVIDSYGAQKTGWPQQTANWIYASALPIDMNNDNTYEIAIGDFNQSNSPKSSLYVFDNNGNRIDSAGGLYGITAISAIDINNDNYPELFVNGNMEYNLESHYYGLDNNLNMIDNWRFTTIGNTLFSPLVFGDLNNTSLTSAVTVSKEKSASNNFLNIWESSLLYDDLQNQHPFFLINKKHNGYIPNQFTTDISNDVTQKDDINIYPNPTNGAFIVESISLIQHIEILNYNGKLLISQSGSSKRSKVDVNHLLNGAYVIKIRTDKGYYYRKLIKH